MAKGTKPPAGAESEHGCYVNDARTEDDWTLVVGPEGRVSVECAFAKGYGPIPALDADAQVRVTAIGLQYAGVLRVGHFVSNGGRVRVGFTSEPA